MPFVTQTVQLATGTGAHAAGDAVGVAFTLANMAREPGLGGEIRSVVLMENTTQAASATLFLFSAMPSPVADDAPYAPTDADMQRTIGFVPITAYPVTAPATNQVATAAGIGLAYQCAPGDNRLYGQVQTNGTPTYAASGVYLTVTTYFEEM